MDAGAGITIGLVVAALLLGLRHGIDWDHIVAITDIAATQPSRRRGVFLGTLYVLGHAAVIIALGVVAIALGSTVPSWLDAVMGKLVGITLIVLGAAVAVTLIQERGEFRARSRWIILFETSRRLFRGPRTTVHAHDHAGVDEVHHGEVDPSSSGGSRIKAPIHSHEHSHAGDGGYSNATSVGIGMLHGVGAETPTQVVVFLAAASAGGMAAGLSVLLAFVVGLVAANSLITLASAFGLAAAAKRRRVQLVMGTATAVMSILVGGLFLFGFDGALPAFFAG
jgi:high-affinity nickel-transport protein